MVLAEAVRFLMLLVCANLSNLLLVRASARRREMAVRMALGAPRVRLVRQLLVESVVLCGSGAALGAALAVSVTFAVSRLQGTTIPLLNSVRVDVVVLGFTVLVAMIAGVASGLLPALHASAFAFASLAEGARGSTDGRSGHVRRVLVVPETALACVLLPGAGLPAHDADSAARGARVRRDRQRGDRAGDHHQRAAGPQTVSRWRRCGAIRAHVERESPRGGNRRRRPLFRARSRRRHRDVHAAAH